MKTPDALVCTIDLLFLLLVLFYLSFLAIKYDASKGLDERDFAWVAELQATAEDIAGDQTSAEFHAIILEGERLTLYHYLDAAVNKLGDFDSPEGLIDLVVARRDLPCVLYEKSTSVLLGSTVRNLALEGVSIGLAEMSPKGE